MKLVFATHNPGKVQEVRILLADTGFEILSAEEAGVSEDVIEDGKTFEENALKKARFVAGRFNHTAWVVAEDAGCCIEALNGAPGVYSARWAGEGASNETIVAHTLSAMREVADGKRQASFQNVIALIAPDGLEKTFLGRVDGHIATEPHGTARPKLPYDAIFVPTGHDRTFAEMSTEEKNSLSHRGRAFQQLREFLKTQRATDDSDSVNQQLRELQERNRRVEADKAWETSIFRVLTLTAITYAIAGLVMTVIHAERPFVNALIPAVGFFLSTQSLPFIKRWWIQRRLK